jgi:cobalt-zinc-cadmium efflux system protein
MSHSHSHHHAHNSSKNLKAAFFLNLLFAFIELFGGWYTNSVAILSDALHDLGDSFSLGLSWYFDRLSKKGKNKNYSFGYRRFSVLGAVINSVVLVSGSILIVVEAVPRLFDPVMPNAEGMILLAVAGVLVNAVAAYRISHGHSLNERVAYLHLLEDVLGWVVTLIVAVILHFRAIPILDPLLSILISIYILYHVVKNLKSSLSIILQVTPHDIDPEKIEESIRYFEEVEDVHDCHIWTMDGDYHVLSIHVVTKGNLSIQQLMPLKAAIKAKLSELKIDHSTLEFESKDENCNPC